MSEKILARRTVLGREGQVYQAVRSDFGQTKTGARSLREPKQKEYLERGGRFLRRAERREGLGQDECGGVQFQSAACLLFVDEWDHPPGARGPRVVEAPRYPIYPREVAEIHSEGSLGHRLVFK